MLCSIYINMYIYIYYMRIYIYVYMITYGYIMTDKTSFSSIYLSFICVCSLIHMHGTRIVSVHWCTMFVSLSILTSYTEDF